MGAPTLRRVARRVHDCGFARRHESVDSRSHLSSATAQQFARDAELLRGPFGTFVRNLWVIDMTQTYSFVSRPAVRHTLLGLDLNGHRALHDLRQRAVRDSQQTARRGMSSIGATLYERRRLGGGQPAPVAMTRYFLISIQTVYLLPSNNVASRSQIPWALAPIPFVAMLKCHSVPVSRN